LYNNRNALEQKADITIVSRIQIMPKYYYYYHRYSIRKSRGLKRKLKLISWNG